MHRHHLPFIAIIYLVATTHATESRAEENLAFDGVWKAISVQKISQNATTDKIDNVSIVIYGNQYVFFREDKAVAAGDCEAVSPNLFTLFRDGRPIQKGRYIEGNPLRLFFMAPVVEAVKPKQPLYSLIFVRLLAHDDMPSDVLAHKLTSIRELRRPAIAYRQLVAGKVGIELLDTHQ